MRYVVQVHSTMVLNHGHGVRHQLTTLPAFSLKDAGNLVKSLQVYLQGDDLTTPGKIERVCTICVQFNTHGKSVSVAIDRLASFARDVGKVMQELEQPDQFFEDDEPDDVARTKANLHTIRASNNGRDARLDD